MKKFKGKGKKIIITLALAVFLLQAVIPSTLEAKRWEMDDCRDAYIKCGFVALVTAFSNPYLGLTMAGLCSFGHAWCIDFAD